MHSHLTDEKDKYNYILIATNTAIITYETHESACSAYVDARRMEKAGYRITVILVNATAHSAEKVGVYIYKKQMPDLYALALEEIKLLNKKDEATVIDVKTEGTAS